jgi:catechol 2,3-dioxygenase-like lactoylglutathione lyase family enzyme
MTTTAHEGLHSDSGGRPGDHAGRASDPVIKVADLAWLEFDRTDLAKAETFAVDFGFTVVSSTTDELRLRGADAGAPCLLLRRGSENRFVGTAFQAAEDADLVRLAARTSTTVRLLSESLGGRSVNLVDPSGFSVRVVAGVPELPALPTQPSLTWNVDHQVARVNATQRPPAGPATVQRLGHLVVQSTRFVQALDWYLELLGLIVSDFLYVDRQRQRGPVMAFIRCDRGSVPTDHHTLAMHLGPSDRYVHSAFQVSDLDALAMGQRHLDAQGYRHAWGIGRHVQGSQIFDYWRDPDGFMVEHFCDGDVFDSSAEPGWAEFCSSGLSQWGPRVTREFLGTKPGPDAIRDAVAGLNAIRGGTELDARRLLGLLRSTTR